MLYSRRNKNHLRVKIKKKHLKALRENNFFPKAKLYISRVR